MANSFDIRWVRIPHYYGDIVRQLFMGLVVLMLIGSPFYTTEIEVQFPLIAVGALIIVALAGLTNPLKRWVMWVDTSVAGAGVIIYETLAVVAYREINAASFVLAQAIAIIFVVAFYFSMKTLRAMLLNQIGKEPSMNDFGEEDISLVPNEDTSSVGQDTPRDGLGRPAAPETDKLD